MHLRKTIPAVQFLSLQMTEVTMFPPAERLQRCIRTKYRKNLNKVLFQIIDPAIGPDVEASTVIWYGVYYDENGELQYRLIHQTDAMGEHISDNDALNEVYAWLLEHEK